MAQIRHGLRRTGRLMGAETLILKQNPWRFLM
jgi:hypothetical protein